jgi:predicted GTPase
MASQSRERLAISIANQCTDVKHVNGMNLYKLPLERKRAFSESSDIVKRYSFGNARHPTSADKTILLMGATGSGKTTWINAMINYILGVEWDDPFRFILVDEEVNKNQAHSQTQEVTAYDIHYRTGFRIPFSLTIVDTPGFGDTQGISRDREITSAVKKFFEDKNGIEVMIFNNY